MMQHQYWVTKKTVLKKLGTKEDDCIVSSDAELDAKLELFRSISDSCLQLQRVLDQYQERICILAQEENSLGKFLRDAGKNSDASGKHMVSAGKAISYSGQQRLSVRGPLLRLYHEVETFRGRAVSDMRATVSAMEKARIEYRAALSWMKSASAQLDPDTGRDLDNFRKAQRQVRESKKVFDKLTLDVLQKVCLLIITNGEPINGHPIRQDEIEIFFTISKIDLLAAARCNMFSHVLSNYQGSFLSFASKVVQTLEATADTMRTAPQYEFCILKELSQTLEEGEIKQDVVPQDKDQMLFFQAEYKDDNTDKKKPKLETEELKNDNKQPSSDNTEDPATSVNLIDTGCTPSEAVGDSTGTLSDLAGLRLDCGDMPANFGSFMPSQLLQTLNTSSILQGPLSPVNTNNNKTPELQQNSAKAVTTRPKDKAAWFKLFAELDPLANPDNLLGSNTNQSHSA